MENKNNFNFKNAKAPSAEEIKKAAAGKDLEGLINTLSQADKDKLNELLKDREKAKKMLESDAAKQIMKKLFGENRNGN